MLFPSVTEVLKQYQDFSGVSQGIMERAGIRGTAVHSYCCNIANGIPAVGVPDDYQHYVDAFQAWVSEFVSDTLFTEERLIDEALGFHGQPDLVVTAKDKSNILIDMKTGVFGMKLWPIQLVAYKHLLELIGHKIDRTAVLLLNQKPAKLIEYTVKATHLNLFFQMLNIHRYLRNEEGAKTV